MEGLRQQGRSLAETPSYLVASAVTVLVFVCLFVERSIYRFGRWLKETKRKALFTSLEKIKEELMLLGLISLMLAQWANWFSQICVSSSLFSSKFYLCSQEDFDSNKDITSIISFSSSNTTAVPPKGLDALASRQCGEGREPFVSYEGLEQLHRFLFVLGITHVFYSFVAVGLAMSKIYSWKKWENLPGLSLSSDGDLQAKKTKVMARQSTFVSHHTSHPWSRSRILIWILCFLRQFRSSVRKSDYLALRQGFINKHNLPSSYNFHKYMVRSMEDEFQGILGISWPLWGYMIVCIFINIHGSNIYFWLSFIPAILVMLVGMKLEHVVSLLALEIMEPAEPTVTMQVKPRDDLFWFRKPEILLHLIQFIIFQNAFEMATFIWSLWGFKQRSCFMKNHLLVIIRLASGVLVQFWCSNSTVPLNVIVTQMGSRCKKALVVESVRDSLHSWRKRVKARSKRGSQCSYTVRSVCSIESTIDERDEITVVSGTLSRTSSLASMNQDTVTSIEQLEGHVLDITGDRQDEISYRMEEFLSESLRLTAVPPETDMEGDAGIRQEDDIADEETLEENLKKT